MAFVALDRNENGHIDNGKELFGAHIRDDAANGIHALTLMAQESNGGIMRGSVDEDNPLFAKLLLWCDQNQNGVSEPSELQRVGQVLDRIGLGYAEVNRRDEHGNLFRFSGWAHVRLGTGRNPPTRGPVDEAQRFVELLYVGLLRATR